MNYLEKSNESYNKHYRLYRASWCHKSGLPMYGKKEFPTVLEQGLYTRHRAKVERVVIDETTVFAWYRMPQGYTPLFKKEVLK